MALTKRGKGENPVVADEATPAETRALMIWAQCLKCVFSIDIETCRESGGVVKVVPNELAAQAFACIEDSMEFNKILTHLEQKATMAETNRLPEGWMPPHAETVPGQST